MGEFKVWILGACFAAAACALMEMLCPSGAMQKSARTVTAIFFLCAILIPAAKALEKITFVAEGTVQTASGSQEIKEKIEEQSKAIAENSVRNMVLSLLKRHNIEPVRVEVAVKTLEDGSIGLERTKIWLNTADYPKAVEVKNLIYEELGLESDCLQ